MNLVLLASGVMLMALPGWTASLGRRLPPRDWAFLSAGSLRTGLVAVRIGLALTAAPAVLRAVGVHGLAEACHQLLGPVAPVGVLSAGGSLAALVVVQSRIVRVRRRCRRNVQRMRVEPWLGRHDDHGDHELIVVPTESSLAYAVAGHPSQIVVSDGLTRVLSPAELSAVISHERCHLQHSHQRHLELALVAETALAPFRAARRSAATLRLAVERWADETAAEQTDRAWLRSALEKVVVSMLDAVPAFTTAETLRARLDALHTTPQPTPRHCRFATVTPAVTLTVIVAGALLTGVPPVHHGALSLLNYCPL
jgi:beta-lactamase regulating signal transducer with metallopeptidase domain